jgi:hypothetical protein
MPPPVRARKGPLKKEEEERKFGWKMIRISYRTLQIWGVILLVATAGAVVSVLNARSKGTESFVGRVFSIARRKVDQRIKLLAPGTAQEEILEQRFATLSFVSGSVKVQRATDLAWQDAGENMRLATGDRVRTFGSARAEVSFDDGNVLRIKPDSLIVIGDLTENVRTKVKKSSVRLLVSSVEADIKKSVVRGSQFKIEMPTATADIEKARLSVEIRADKQSQVNVYSGQVDIDTGQAKVQVTDRKSVMISALKQITSPENLLPPPRLTQPRALENFYTATGGAAVACAWGAVPGARSYRLEVSGDRFFDKTAVARDDIRETSFQTPSLGEGIYHLRVAAVDAQGRPGLFSEPIPLRVVLDRFPPFVEIQKFVVLKAGRGREILVNGRTEPHVTLTVAGRAIVVDDSGYFSTVLRDVPISQGELEITARDRAGNVKSIRQAVQS